MTPTRMVRNTARSRKATVRPNATIAGDSSSWLLIRAPPGEVLAVSDSDSVPQVDDHGDDNNGTHLTLSLSTYNIPYKRERVKGSIVTTSLRFLNREYRSRD